MRTMVGIDIVKSSANFFSKNFDGYITGSLGPAGSQIRKKEFLNNFFYFAFGGYKKNSSYTIKIKGATALLPVIKPETNRLPRVG